MIEWLADLWVVITSIVTISAIIVKYTPTDWDDEMLRRIKAALDFVAINPKSKREP